MVTLPDTPESSDKASQPLDEPTESQELLSGVAKTVFRLNGQLLSIAEVLAGSAGLTAAWWQVLATVLREPQSVAEISRSIGNSRQSVQRVADILVDKGLAEYQPNPAHRRAKLLAATQRGRAAVKAIQPAHVDLAKKLIEETGEDQLHEILDSLQRLTNALETLGTEPDTNH